MAENTPFDLDVTMTRGDARTIPLEFYDEDDVAENVSGWDFFYTAKKSFRDTDIDAAISLDPLDIVPYGTSFNKIDINITEALSAISSGKYHHDIQAKNTNGVFTVARGTLVIEDDVTKRTEALP